MSLLTFALCGIGFCGFLALDITPVRRYPAARALTTLLSIASLAASLAYAWPRGETLGLPAWRQWAAILLVVAGGSLTAYSTLVEIPLALARNPQRGPLVMTGTYALCRHPGFLWIVFFLAGLVLLVNRSGMLELAAYWALFDLLLVGVQDQLVFPRLFPTYPQYHLSTPFVIPSASSIRNALQSARGFHEHVSTEDERPDPER